MTSRTIARDEVALAMRASSPLSARRQRAVTAVLAFASICGSFMQTLVLPVQAALPELLHTGREETAWVITATSLTGAVVTPIAGRIGDMFGKLRVVIGLLGFMVLGSVIAAFSTEIVGLVIGRSLQGFVLGIVPVAMSILRDTLPAERISGGVALVSASVGIGAALGLPLSATIMTVADWHLIFWLSVGLGGLSLLLVLLVVPPSTGTVRGRFDVPGAVGLAVGLSGVLLAISWLHVWGWTSPLTLAFGGGGLLVLVLWGWYETRVASPIADLRLMVRPRVLLANLCSMTTGFAFFSCIVTVPQILELPVGLGSGLGLDVLASAVIVMLHGVVMLALSPVAARLVRRIGPELLLALASALLVSALIAAAFAPRAVPTMIVVMIVFGIGLAFGFASTPIIIMTSVPREQTAAANAVNQLSRSIGSTVAAAVVGAVLAASSTSLGGQPVPSTGGFTVSFLLAAVACAATVVIALCIPRRRGLYIAGQEG